MPAEPRSADLAATKSFTADALAVLVAGRLLGPGDLAITGVAQIDRAQTGELTFIGEQRYAPAWATSGASAALVSAKVTVEPVPGKALIQVDNADLAMAKVLQAFAPPPPAPPLGVHPSAVVDPTARLGQSVRIGPHCILGPNVTLGDRCILHGQVTLMADCSIAADCILWPGVVIRERCSLGERCILHPNVTIGADGFGYRVGQSPDGPVPVKIPQIGTVEVASDVEIGAGSCIDRGKFAATVIGTFTKIDNLVQIGHNCEIGRGVIIAGCCGIAGSVRIGDGAMLGGMVALKDHIEIGAGAMLAGCAQVVDDVPAGQTWAGSPAQPVRQAIQQAQLLRKLPDLVKQFRAR
jgi:UDP-3-O-[3-hydroxymyristoyl] glucosamine N-acyltransferase